MLLQRVPFQLLENCHVALGILGVLLIWLKVGQGPVVFAEDVGWGQFLTVFLSSLPLSWRQVNITDILLAEPLNL